MHRIIQLFVLPFNGFLCPYIRCTNHHARLKGREKDQYFKYTVGFEPWTAML